MKIQACMNKGAGIHRPRYRHKSHAKCDVDAGIVGNWRFVVGKVEFALSVIIPHLKFSAVPFRHRGSEGEDEGEEPAGRASGTRTGLSPKVKEFVYIAIDCATTHLYVPDLKLHIRNAVRLGATPEEAMEVFELASLMGV